jgi:hypothetical protein
MDSPRVTRSSVLGKRSQTDSPSTDQLKTPDSTPALKRSKTVAVEHDGQTNKENIPPLTMAPPTPDSTPAQSRRAIRRASTDGTPTRARQSTCSALQPGCNNSYFLSTLTHSITSHPLSIYSFSPILSSPRSAVHHHSAPNTSCCPPASSCPHQSPSATHLE